MNFLERVYFPEIVRGLWVTAKHFFRNLFYHAAGLFSDRLGQRGAVTFQFPEVKRPLAPRLRTLHRLTKREDGSPRCVACMMCETICPAECIHIVAGEHPDPAIEKYPVKFEIDLGRCVFCGFCVEACPVDAIRMDTGKLDFSSYSRKGMILQLEDLLANNPD